MYENGGTAWGWNKWGWPQKYSIRYAAGTYPPRIRISPTGIQFIHVFENNCDHFMLPTISRMKVGDPVISREQTTWPGAEPATRDTRATDVY
ncbi:MAG: hypothetical protein K6T81_20245, partial [Alicyclobacillus macrosporangiidus]|uniref:hypothetical protein n=1 Tax=Alicyclobacillus macrosporangiidus TaxID=392015 RepID=UPI0026EC126B